MMPPLPATCVLLAAGFDWLEALLPFLFVVFWIVSQVFAVFRRLQGGRPAGEVHRPRPAPRPLPVGDRPRPPARDPADLRTELEDQIAEFLREVNGERRGGPSSRQARERVERKPPAAAGKPPAPARKTVVAAAAEPIAVVEKPGQGQQAADVSVARHVQDVFSRELSHLRGTLAHDEQQAETARRSKPTSAEELVHLLRNPATIRQVILLREVIDRPVDRW